MAVLTPRNAGGGLALLPCSIVRDDLDEAVTEEGPLRCGHLRAMYATGRLPLTAWPCKRPIVLTLQQAAIDAFILEEVERRACRSDCDQGVLGAQCRARLA